MNPINYLRNAGNKRIIGAYAFQTINIVDHANSKQHSTIMAIQMHGFAASGGSGPTSYAPIAQALEKLVDREMQGLGQILK